MRPDGRKASMHKRRMDLFALEQSADNLYRLGGFPEYDQVFPSTLAMAILGSDCLCLVDGLKSRGRLVMDGGAARIEVRASLGTIDREDAIAHELGHLEKRLRSERVHENTEAECSYVGAALCARRDVFRERIRETTDFRELAEDFGTTETLIALRFGELTETPVAVVAPHLVRIRGREWSWPTESVIRRGIPGLRKTSFVDDRRRFALVAGGEQ